MTCEVHAFEAREGGSFRISLTYESPTGTGKTTAHSDTYHGHFVKLVPNEQVVEEDEFETTKPMLRGKMTITITLADADGGTEVVARPMGCRPACRPPITPLAGKWHKRNSPRSLRGNRADFRSWGAVRPRPMLGVMLGFGELRTYAASAAGCSGERMTRESHSRGSRWFSTLRSHRCPCWVTLRTVPAHSDSGTYQLAPPWQLDRKSALIAASSNGISSIRRKICAARLTGLSSIAAASSIA
jgi:hypothetical protein